MGDSLSSSSACPSNPVDIIVKATHRHVVVDDDANVLDIKASACHVSRYQDVGLILDWLLELGVYLISLPLLLVAMDCTSFILDGFL
jgi:hypothetical protein